MSGDILDGVIVHTDQGCVPARSLGEPQRSALVAALGAAQRKHEADRTAMAPEERAEIEARQRRMWARMAALRARHGRVRPLPIDGREYRRRTRTRRNR